MTTQELKKKTFKIRIYMQNHKVFKKNLQQWIKKISVGDIWNEI